jgi:hypothetical protein
MMDKTNINCINCNDQFLTYWWIEEGMPVEMFCCSDCMEEYYSIESRRDILIENIIN